MDTALTETRAVLQQDMSMKYIIQIMLQNVWKSVPLWVQHLERTLSERILIQEISLSY